MSALATKVPVLRDGERMDAETFWELYEAAPPGVRAELVGGVVRMATPSNLDDHGTPHEDWAYPLATYRRRTPGVRSGIGPTIRLGIADAPEPDHVMMIENGGTARIVDGYITGPPELACEIAASTDSFDRNAKMRGYAAAGIPEYVIWRTLRRLVEWYVLEDGAYVLLPPGTDGIIRSRIFPGLWIDPTALLERNHARVDEVLALGLASPEHAAFVADLASRSAGA